MDDEEIKINAYKYVQQNKDSIIRKFCSLEEYPPSQKPFTFFMAGSPGSGKTEFSKSIIPELQKRDPENKIIRIDIDEIRTILPGYVGSNSYLFHQAASKGVDIIFDHSLKYNQNCILDGTFSNFSISYQNVSKSLKKKRDVGIFYIYQNPYIAWDYTKKREKLENRHVPKDVFINSFFNSRENVIKIKEIFQNKIEINMIVQDENNHVARTLFNVDTIEKSLHSQYTISSLFDTL